ncbi:MAG TPA: hypothetical protein PL110_14900 [Candidatus Eremiobacteraeota bacterium]|nr:MAG: hypothetical protein BWY64_00350 [bacterium ADurb.Bin363]HPZ09391.1 hypothetical protein [Candidatus Eremiobacteraeota bacterium]
MDYELRIAAEISRDKTLIKSYKEGKNIHKLYYEFEEETNGTYEIIRDLEDNDIADRLMREIRYITDDLQWMIPAEDLRDFLKELLKKTPGD